MSATKYCVCCQRMFVLPRPRYDGDPWDGRMNAYCDRCALTRCDAYPGDCPVKASAREKS